MLNGLLVFRYNHGSGIFDFDRFERPEHCVSVDEKALDDLGSRYRGAIGNPFRRFLVRRILSERDIRPEADDKNPGIPYDTIDPILLNSNGDGATTFIKRLLINDKVNEHYMQSTEFKYIFINCLNAIYSGDSLFSNIEARLIDNVVWELFLGERRKGLVPLSATGSGLKTVILVLLNVVIYPWLFGNPGVQQHIFSFEEI
jgi:putative ATP-dependent endonuclease of the OLD family